MQNYDRAQRQTVFPKDECLGNNNKHAFLLYSINRFASWEQETHTPLNIVIWNLQPRQLLTGKYLQDRHGQLITGGKIAWIHNNHRYLCSPFVCFGVTKWLRWIYDLGETSEYHFIYLTSIHCFTACCKESHESVMPVSFGLVSLPKQITAAKE